MAPLFLTGLGSLSRSEKGVSGRRDGVRLWAPHTHPGRSTRAGGCRVGTSASSCHTEERAKALSAWHLSPSRAPPHPLCIHHPSFLLRGPLALSCQSAPQVPKRGPLRPSRRLQLTAANISPALAQHASRVPGRPQLMLHPSPRTGTSDAKAQGQVPAQGHSRMGPVGICT